MNYIVAIRWKEKSLYAHRDVEHGALLQVEAETRIDAMNKIEKHVKKNEQLKGINIEIILAESINDIEKVQ